MSELRKANTDHAYFLTFTIVGWIDAFTRKELSNIIIRNLQNTQKDHAVAIYCYVIMSNQKVEYIHNNPEIATIVTDPSYYYYSSANPLSTLKVDEY